MGLAKSVGMGVVKTGIVAFKVVLVFFYIKSTSWKNEHRVEASIKEAVSKKIEEIKICICRFLGRKGK